jgi:class 3 adenylate cyclase
MDDNTVSTEYLGELTEEEFGGGNELSSTGFLVFGLLTFWIYTVLTYSKCLQRHFDLRLDYFNSLLKQRDSEKEVQIPELIVSRGFSPKSYPAPICVILYFISMALAVGRAAGVQLGLLGAFGYETLRKMDMVAAATASFLFCLSSILFVWWVCRVIKDHEYFELLFAKFVQNPDNFKIVPPSQKFVKRWDRNNNRIALFLILCIPMTVSPLMAAKHFYSIIDAGKTLDHLIIIWQIILYGCAAAFHIWGTQILMNMYNDHLRIENFSRTFIFGNGRIPVAGNSVVDESSRQTPVSRDIVPERSLSAIMLTDIVGYSKKMESDEEGMYATLLKHNEIIREKIKENNGREIKTIGDAFLVRFSSAVDAVRTGIGIQQALSNYNKDRDLDEKIMVRIGIHIGDVLVMDGDIIGNGVNIASRIEPLAEPGGICISADVYNLIKKSLDIKVVNIGKKELKNISDAPEIYKILVETIRDSQSGLK